MPILKSAKKALRQNKKRRLLNLRRLWAMHKIIKKIEKSAGSIPKEELQKLLSSAQKIIDKVAKRGIIKRNTAARKKSRLAKIINKNIKKVAPTKQSLPPTNPKQPPAQPSQS